MANNLIKVVGFPSEDIMYGGESMWVELGIGDENDGWGILRNTPPLSDLEHSDFIEYGGGTLVHKPHYLGKAPLLDIFLPKASTNQD